MDYLAKALNLKDAAAITATPLSGRARGAGGNGRTLLNASTSASVPIELLPKW